MGFPPAVQRSPPPMLSLCWLAPGWVSGAPSSSPSFLSSPLPFPGFLPFFSSLSAPLLLPPSPFSPSSPFFASSPTSLFFSSFLPPPPPPPLFSSLATPLWRLLLPPWGRWRSLRVRKEPVRAPAAPTSQASLFFLHHLRSCAASAWGSCGNGQGHALRCQGEGSWLGSACSCVDVCFSLPLLGCKLFAVALRLGCSCLFALARSPVRLAHALFKLAAGPWLRRAACTTPASGFSTGGLALLRQPAFLGALVQLEGGSDTLTRVVAFGAVSAVLLGLHCPSAR